MRRVLFFLLCCLLIPDIYSQHEWFPIGTEWYYEWGGPSSVMPVLSKRYFAEKDTVVDGKTCRLIRGGNSKDILFEENGSVYYYFNNSFRKIYDFTVNEGDVVELELKSSSGINFRMMDSTMILPCTIQKIQTKTVDGVELKEICATYPFRYEVAPDVWLTEWGTFWYLEKIGCERPGTLNPILLYAYPPGDEFIPYVCVSNNPPEVYHRLRCYHDPDMEYITDWWKLQNKPCDDGTVSNIKADNTREVVIYPNPVNERLTVSGVHGNGHEVTIVLYDAAGQVVLEKKTPIPCELNVAHLIPGIYYIQISDDAVIFTDKIIKL